MTQPKPLPPLETLRAAFAYCPETGALTRRETGAPAGWLGPKGYAQVQLNGRTLKAHRVAWCLHQGADPGPLQVDHVNRVRSDNRASNLRLVGAAGNRANSTQLSPVQVTHPDGSTRLHPSTAAAAAALGCARASVDRYAIGLSQPPAGLTVAYA